MRSSIEGAASLAGLQDDDLLQHLYIDNDELWEYAAIGGDVGCPIILKGNPGVEDLEGRRIATPFPEAIAAYKSWLRKRSVTVRALDAVTRHLAALIAAGAGEGTAVHAVAEASVMPLSVAGSLTQHGF